MVVRIDSFTVDWISWAIGIGLFVMSLLSGWSWFSYLFIATVIIVPLRFLLPIPIALKPGVAVITGGSTGIGRALATVLAQAHYDLILVARGMDGLKTAQYQLQHQYGVTVHLISKDLSTPTAGQELFEEIEKMGVVSKVTILVNNAGFGSVGPFLSTPLSQVASMTHINMTTLPTLTHLFGNVFKQQGGGKILQVASTAAFQPGPDMATYYATKAYVATLSQAIAYELRGSHVTISTLCPGPVISSFGARAGNEHSNLFKYGPLTTPDAVAQLAWSGLLRGDALIIPGTNIFSYWAARYAPASWIIAIAHFCNQPAI